MCSMLTEYFKSGNSFLYKKQTNTCEMKECLFMDNQYVQYTIELYK